MRFTGSGRTKHVLPLFAGLSLVLAACAGSGGSGGDCDGYPSQDVELVIPYGPGGGFDSWARLIAPVMQEKLPGDAAVVPVNREGAGGLTGVTEVLNADPDGYEIVITEPGVLVTQQLAGTTDADFSKLQAIGRITVGPEVIVVSTNSDWQTIEDVQADADESDPFLMASGGIAAINIVSFDALELPWENVQHEGSAEALLSIIRGDTDIAVYPLTTVQDGISGGDLRPLVVIGPKPDEGQPGAAEVADVPSLDELTGQDGIGNALAQTRILAAPPETPQCVMDTLEQAMADTYQDEAFLAQLEEAGRIPVYGDAELAQGVVEDTYATLGDYKDLLLENLSE